MKKNNKYLTYFGTVKKYDYNHEKKTEIIEYKDKYLRIHMKIRRTESILNFYKIIKEEFEKNGYTDCEIVRYIYPYKHYNMAFTKGGENNMHETFD